MAELSYSMIASLDGYVEDADGRFDWAEPDAEVHAFVNDREREVGTYLFGRGMYRTMAPWGTDPSLAEGSPETRDFAAIWNAADKVVYSSTPAAVPTARTRLERTFDAEVVRELKRSASREIIVAGPGLAAAAIAAGLVDEVRLLLVPVVVGGGKPVFPRGQRLDLELLAERRFAGGTVHLSYRVRR